MLGLPLEPQGGGAGGETGGGEPSGDESNASYLAGLDEPGCNELAQLIATRPEGTLVDLSTGEIVDPGATPSGELSESTLAAAQCSTSGGDCYWSPDQPEGLLNCFCQNVSCSQSAVHWDPICEECVELPCAETITTGAWFPNPETPPEWLACEELGEGGAYEIPEPTAEDCEPSWCDGDAGEPGGEADLYPCDGAGVCPGGQEWNPLTCTCEPCPEEECGLAEVWNQDECRCEFFPLGIVPDIVHPRIILELWASDISTTDDEPVVDPWVSPDEVADWLLNPYEPPSGAFDCNSFPGTAGPGSPHGYVMGYDCDTPDVESAYGDTCSYTYSTCDEWYRIEVLPDGRCMAVSQGEPSQPWVQMAACEEPP